VQVDGFGKVAIFAKAMAGAKRPQFDCASSLPSRAKARYLDAGSAWEAIETAASQESVYALSQLTGHITDEMHAMTPDEFREYVAREKGTVGNGGEGAGK
jgi:hypothetical protein